ncbi:MAG: DMT family transporter [Sarcina sp.]
MKNSSRFKGILLVMIGTLLWGISGVVVQFLFQDEHFTAQWFVVIRMLSAGVIIFIACLIKGDKNIFYILKGTNNIIKLLIFSIFGMLAVQYCFFASISAGNAPTASILQYLAPIIILVYLSLRHRKLPTLKQVLCIAITAIGVFFIITKGDIHSLSVSKAAIFWGLLSAFASAIYTLQPVSLLKKYGSLPVIAWGMIIGGIFFSFIHSPFNYSGTFCVKSIIAMVFIIIFGTVFSFYCYLESLKYIEGYEASMLGCIEPLSASILSVIFLNLGFNLVQWIGTFLIIIAITIISLKK